MNHYNKHTYNHMKVFIFSFEGIKSLLKFGEMKVNLNLLVGLSSYNKRFRLRI